MINEADVNRLNSLLEDVGTVSALGVLPTDAIGIDIPKMNGEEDDDDSPFPLLINQSSESNVDAYQQFHVDPGVHGRSECPACQGFGRDENSVESKSCKRCKGTGMVDDKEPLGSHTAHKDYKETLSTSGFDSFLSEGCLTNNPYGVVGCDSLHSKLRSAVKGGGFVAHMQKDGSADVEIEHKHADAATKAMKSHGYKSVSSRADGDRTYLHGESGFDLNAESMDAYLEADAAMDAAKQARQRKATRDEKTAGKSGDLGVSDTHRAWADKHMDKPLYADMGNLPPDTKPGEYSADDKEKAKHKQWDKMHGQGEGIFHHDSGDDYERKSKEARDNVDATTSGDNESPFDKLKRLGHHVLHPKDDRVIH